MINAKKYRTKIEWERIEIFFKKIRDTKGTFRAKMGTIKDKTGMELTKAEDIKKRWQGVVLRWWRNRMGDHFSPHKFIERSFEC